MAGSVADPIVSASRVGAPPRAVAQGSATADGGAGLFERLLRALDGFGSARGPLRARSLHQPRSCVVDPPSAALGWLVAAQGSHGCRQRRSSVYPTGDLYTGRVAHRINCP